MNQTEQTTAAVEEMRQKINQCMKAPMDLYNAPRVENEIDLVAEVRERLISMGLKEKVEQAFDTNRFIIEAQGKTSNAQQFNLNRFFTLQFMAAKEDAQLQRYSLIYEINAKEWLTIFDATILPAIVDFDLPVIV